jgi:hypothetical protein
MLGKILGAVIGRKAAGGTSGAILGATGATMLKRAGLPTLLTVAVGGYALKKWKDKRDKRKSFETPSAGTAA